LSYQKGCLRASYRLQEIEYHPCFQELDRVPLTRLSYQQSAGNFSYSTFYYNNIRLQIIRPRILPEHYSAEVPLLVQSPVIKVLSKAMRS